MTKYDRVFNTASRKRADCIPITPYTGNYGAAVAGVPLGTYCRDGKIMAAAQEKALQILDLDTLVPQSDGYYIAEGLGVKVRHNENDIPSYVKPAIDSLSDVGKLRVPNPETDGRMGVYLEAISILASKYKGSVPIRAPGTGAFSLAGHLLGTQNFLTEIAIAHAEDDAQARSRLHALMQICCETVIEFSKAALRCGADIIINGDSLASLNMTSPDIYAEYCFPYEMQFFKAMESMRGQYKFLSILHICGDNTKVMPMLGSTGCDILEVDYTIDLAYYKKTIGDKVCIMGNLNPAGALLYGTPQQVYDEAKAAIDACANPDGVFMLGSGCEVAVATPVENMKMMVKAAREASFNM